MNTQRTPHPLAAALALGCAALILPACSWSVYGDAIPASQAKAYAGGDTPVPVTQVLAELGEPPLSYEDINTIAYRWEDVSKIQFHDPSKSKNPINLSAEKRYLHHKFYLFCVQYDDAGTVVRAERFRTEPVEGEDPWAEVEAVVRNWAAAGDAPAE